jgi:hypothetical protein
MRTQFQTEGLRSSSLLPVTPKQVITSAAPRTWQSRKLRKKGGAVVVEDRCIEGLHGGGGACPRQAAKREGAGAKVR